MLGDLRSVEEAPILIMITKVNWEKPGGRSDMGGHWKVERLRGVNGKAIARLFLIPCPLRTSEGKIGRHQVGQNAEGEEPRLRNEARNDRRSE